MSGQHSVQLFTKFGKKIKILRDIAQTTQGNQVKGTTQLADLLESVNFINEKFQEYEQNRRAKEGEIKKN